MAFSKSPTVRIKTKATCHSGWDQIGSALRAHIGQSSNREKSIAIECYPGVMVEEVVRDLKKCFHIDLIVNASSCLKPEEAIHAMTYPDVTDDRIFGYLSRLNLTDFFDQEKIFASRDAIARTEGIIVVIGAGASLIVEDPSVLIYADMARWEIQQRMRQNLVSNLGISNQKEKFETQYKRGFFVDWRVCDRHKKKLKPCIDFWLDTNSNEPKMINADVFDSALSQTVQQPFSVVPFFDPGPWGGQWMRDQFDLDPEPENFAWCFNCVPEENSLLLQFGDCIFETPSINLVFFHPKELMGEHVHARFGDEFPIRFDFLDTMDGGNLSLQVHPVTEYIQEKFGMHYTQDESYYLLDAKPGAKVYLGLKEDAVKEDLFNDLRAGQNGKAFDADKYVATWGAQKHDHFLIPAGTIHCSGADSMVLEISATPYIFTFKLWDWDRLGIDGKPRPINVDHGERVIQMDRTEKWVQEQLVNRIELLEEGDGWREERTGLHETEFIETRRHWFSKPVHHQTNATVNVLNLVEGEEAIVESPDHSFVPFVVHYAETFVIPANIPSYTIRPYGKSEHSEIATIKAFVRS